MVQINGFSFLIFHHFLLAHTVIFVLYSSNNPENISCTALINNDNKLIYVFNSAQNQHIRKISEVT